MLSYKSVGDADSMCVLFAVGSMCIRYMAMGIVRGWGHVRVLYTHNGGAVPSNLVDFRVQNTIGCDVQESGRFRQTPGSHADGGSVTGGVRRPVGEASPTAVL